MKILVLCGGSSPERNISIKCGSRVCRALRENGHNAVLLDVMSGVNPDIFERSAGEYDLEADVERFRAMNEDIFKGFQNDTITEFVGKGLLDAAKKADVVFPVTHGVNGEDGKLQALLELYGIKYTGAGILSSAISMNKTMSRLTVSSSGVPVADGITISREDYEADPSKYTLSELGLGGRVIVKPESGGSSIGTTDASNEEGFRMSLKEAFTYDEYVVVERFIEGREFSVGVIGKKSYPVVEISVPAGEFYDYKNKYGNVAIETVPADIPEEKAIEIRALAELAAKALRIDSYCRIDFMMDNQGKVYFLEVNNLPGMTPTSLIGKSAAAVGLSFSELCETVIRLVPERR